MLTRRTFLGAALATPAILAGRAHAAPDPFQDLLDGAVARAAREHGAKLGLVMGLVTPEAPGGRLLFASDGGVLSLTGAPQALDADTPFAIGSISKVFTSAIYYKLHGPYAGTLGAALGTAVPLSPPVAALELKNLAIYQPGLPQDNRGGVYPPGTLVSLDSVFAYLSGLTAPLPQGTCYSYSNLGWSLLGMAGVGLAGADTAAYVGRYQDALSSFCATFGARATQVLRPGMAAGVPRGYTRQWKPLAPDTRYRPTRPPMVGGGGIVSTGADMMRFLRYNMGLENGGPADPALAYQQGASFHAPGCTGPAAPQTAYGWFRRDMNLPDRKVTVLSKNGGVAGFTSWMGFAGWQGTGAPSRQGVFVLANGEMATRLGMAGMRLLLGSPT